MEKSENIPSLYEIFTFLSPLLHVNPINKILLEYVLHYIILLISCFFSSAISVHKVLIFSIKEKLLAKLQKYRTQCTCTYLCVPVRKRSLQILRFLQLQTGNFFITNLLNFKLFHAELLSLHK